MLSRSVIRSSKDGNCTGRIAAVRKERELEPALVVVVQRLEELRGSAVWMNTGSLRRAAAPTTDRARGRRSSTACRRPSCRRPSPLTISPMPSALPRRRPRAARRLRPAGTDVAQVEPGEHHHLALVAAGRDGIDRRLETRAGRRVGIDHQAEVQRRHGVADAVDILHRHRLRRMMVKVDDRELRLGTCARGRRASSADGTRGSGLREFGFAPLGRLGRDLPRRQLLRADDPEGDHAEGQERRGRSRFIAFAASR